MLNRIRQILAPPIFEGDEAKTRVASILNTLVLMILATVLLFSIAYPLLSPALIGNLLPEAPLPLFAAIVFVLIRRGQVRLAGFLLPAGMWLAFTIVAVFAGGIASPAFSGYLMVVLIAGVLLGGRVSLAFAGLSALSGLVLVYAEASGHLPEVAQPYSPLVWWFSNAAFFIVGAVLLRLATYSISESLERVHRELAERTRVEEELIKFRLGIERSNDAVFMTQVDGTIIYVNPAFEKTYGYSKEQALGQTPRILKSGTMTLEAYQHFWNTLLAKQVVAGELVNKTKDGRLLHIEDSANPIVDERGDLVGFLAIQRDITERRRAEDVLAEERNLLNMLIDNIPDNIYFKDAESRFIRINRAMARQFGLSDPAQAVGKTDFAFFTEEHARLAYADEQVILRSGQPLVGKEEKETWPNGGAGWVSTTKMPLRDPAGRIVGTFGISRDITIRKRAEAALRESEQALRTVVANAPVILFALDRNGVYTLSEGKGLMARGVNSRQVVGQSAFDLHRDNPKIISALRRAFSGEASNVTFEVDSLVFDVWYSPIRDQNNAIDGVIGVATDVTENRQAQEALRESGERLQQLAASLHEAVWLRDTHTLEILYVNPAYERIWGRSCESFYQDPTSFVEAIHPDDKERILCAIQGQYEGKSFSEEYRIIRPDGTIRWIFGRTYPIKNEAGEIFRITAIAEDITERKHGEQALQESEERYRHLVELTPDAIFVHEDRRFVLANPASARLFGAAQPQDLIGQPILDRVHPEYREIVIKRNRQMDKERKLAALIEEKFLRMDGTAVDVEATAMPFVYRGKPAVQVVARDITNRKRAEEQTRLQLRRLNALHMIDVAITGNFDLRVILNIVLEQVTTQLGVDAAAVLMLNAPMQTLDSVARRGFRFRAIEKAHVRLNGSYAGKAVRERSIVHVEGQTPTDDSSSFVAAWANEGFVSYYGVPLISKGQVQGVLELYHRTPLQPDPEWSAFLETLATQTAIAIDNTTLFNDLQHSNLELTLAYDTTLEGWSRALDLRDKETEGHTQRVVDLTLRLARKLGIGDDALVHVRRGALLHDIGKMGIPDSILLKPGPLTEREWVIMRKHPEYAHDLISPIAFLRPALDIPYCHHERWDGSGYPRGLKDEEIPLVARAFAVVDVWDALNSDRPYRLAWSKNQVYDYLRAEAGKQFDPSIVKILMVIVGDK